MKTLQLEFVKRNFQFKQVKRCAEAAMYDQVDLSTNQLVGIEVFGVVVNEDYELAGTKIQGGEVYPGDNVFGSTAWSVPVLGDEDGARLRANERYDEILRGA